MQVIKKGRPQKGWAMQYTCTGRGNRGGGCGAVLLVEQGDVFRTESSALHEIDTHHTFECSECGVWTDIQDSLPFTPGRKKPQKVLNEATSLPVSDKS